MKILVAGFQHETNTFAPTVASYESFVRGEDFPAMARGKDILNLLSVNIPIAGFIKHVHEHGHEVLPVIWAGAGASAHTTKDAYERIVGEILEAVKLQTYDAIYLDLHGAMVAEHVDDGEGELLARVRAIVGPDMKIAVSIDSHANVSAQMLALATGVVAYRTYPHIDMADTGLRAAQLLLASVKQKEHLHCVARRVPFLIPVNSMSTMMQPARGIYDQLELLEQTDVLSLSFAPGFPASDFAECGPVVWGYGFDKQAAEQAVEQLFQRITNPESQWSVDFLEADEAALRAVELAKTATKPIIIADTQDNPGVGGDGNTTGMLRSLLKAGAQNAALGLLVDTAAAAAAHKAGVGAEITIELGGCPQVPTDRPFAGTFKVEALSDGKLVFGGPMMNGKHADLGLSARLRIEGVQIVVCSAKGQLLDRNMYRVVGIEPSEKSILVNKSSVHFRADFAEIAHEILVARAPGPFIADPSELPWKNLGHGMRTRPLGPAFRPDVYSTLERLGVTLPPTNAPAAAYVSAVQAGQFVHLSGHLSRKQGAVRKGRLGVDMSTAEGAEAARDVAIDLLSTLHASIGDLNRVQRIVKLTSLVRSSPEYSEHHLVTNGASRLLADVFGPRGVHARSAVGVAALPLEACVEIELVAEIS